MSWRPRSAGLGPPISLAVADGHGSARSWRSRVGSGIAIRAALATLDAFRDGQHNDFSLSAAKRIAEDQLPQVLVREWRELVQAHLARYPFAPAELQHLVAREGDAARRAIADNPAIAYGSTLLATLVTDRFIVYLQLGDGNILTVSEDGLVTGPVPGDDRLFANQTTSLSAPEAWRDVRVAFQAAAGTMPTLILLATDGYANSYPDDESFQRVATDLLQRIREDGFDATTAQLEAWLTATTSAGSGDDISVGLAYRMSAIVRERPEPLALHHPADTLSAQSADENPPAHAETFPIGHAAAAGGVVPMLPLPDDRSSDQ